MVRTYRKITNRGEWSMVAMKTAVDMVLNKEMGCKKAAVLYQLPQSTLERYVRRMRLDTEGELSLPLGPKKTIFTIKEEDELAAYLQGMEESKGAGLTTIELRRLAYQLAVKNGKKHNFNTDKKMAGVDWLKGFEKRHPNLTIRKPDEMESESAEFNMHRLEKKVIGELLVMYKNLPCLWDVTDQFYSNKVARNRAYNKLVEKYKEIDNECDQRMLKKKIDNLRTTYRRERQKVLKSQFHNGDGERYKPLLWYYPLFSFLEQLEHSSDEDSRDNESPETTQAVPDELASTECILRNKRLPQIITSTKVEIANEFKNSTDMVKLEDLVPETVRATESILPYYEEDIGIMTVEPEIEIKYRPEKRPKPSAVYITEMECDYDDEESETPRTKATKRCKKTKSKSDSTSIEIVDDEDEDNLFLHQLEPGNSSGFPENDLFAKTMTAQLSELRPKQRFIAQKLMSEVIFFGRLDKLKTQTKLHLDGD